MIKRIAVQHPLVFSFVVTLIYILMLIASSILAANWPGEAYGQFLGGMVGRIISIIILVLILNGLGWLGPAGFKQIGRWQIWLLLLPALIYTIAVTAYAMTGGFDFSIRNPQLTGVAATFILIAAFLEEITFRGLILYGLVNAWGRTGLALIKSILVSALFFGAVHIVNVLSGQPLTDALLQSLVAFSLGIFLAAVVLSGASIFPAVIFHGLLNLAGYLNLTSKNITETTSSWLLLSLLMVPLALFGLYQLKRTLVTSVTTEAVQRQQLT
jgi:membrane protease YdiL (CAAX protease family)